MTTACQYEPQPVCLRDGMVFYALSDATATHWTWFGRLPPGLACAMGVKFNSAPLYKSRAEALASLHGVTPCPACHPHEEESTNPDGDEDPC